MKLMMEDNPAPDLAEEVMELQDQLAAVVEASRPLEEVNLTDEELHRVRVEICEALAKHDGGGE
jgi:hypothetical protein